VNSRNSDNTEDEPPPAPAAWYWRALRGLALILAGATASALLLAVFVFALVYSNLPPIDALTDYRPKIPLRVWTADGVLIGEFGEERREFVPLSEIPEQLKQAILAAEDDSFYRHHGVDYSGLARAFVSNFASGRRGQGGSTITMQLARTFFLSSERSYLRKLYEIALAYKIERNRKAHFVMLNIEAPGAVVAELERQTRINEDVIRYMTVRVDEHEDGPSVMMRKNDRERKRRDFREERD